MKKFTITAFTSLMLAFSSTAFSQIQAIGVGGGLVMPSGNFSDFAESGFGGTVRLHYKYEGLDNIVLTGSAGYYRFGAKEFNFLGFGTGLKYKWTLVPLTSGGRYYFGDPEAKVNFYLGAEIGVHIFSVTLEDDQGQSASGFGTLDSSTEFSLIPMAGVRLGPLDAYAQYSIAGDFKYFGVKAMVVFPVGKK